MSIEWAILHMISVEPSTGYELKKRMQAIPFMHWSGNNNQIYKALLSLERSGYVTCSAQTAAYGAAKKVYTATPEGLATLQHWVSEASPELPDVRHPLLLQLACAEGVPTTTLRALTARYMDLASGRLAFAEHATSPLPSRSPREEAIWKLLYEHEADLYRCEIAWAKRMEDALSAFKDTETSNRKEESPMEMQYEIKEVAGQRYIFLPEGGRSIQSEEDANALISLVFEHGVNLLLIDGSRLSDEFLRLRTGVAGAVLQKLGNYNVKTAVIMDPNTAKGKFRDFLAESNGGNTFRTYPNQADAEKWLLRQA